MRAKIVNRFGNTLPDLQNPGLNPSVQPNLTEFMNAYTQQGNELSLIDEGWRFDYTGGGAGGGTNAGDGGTSTGTGTGTGTGSGSGGGYTEQTYVPMDEQINEWYSKLQELYKNSDNSKILLYAALGLGIYSIIKK